MWLVEACGVDNFRKGVAERMGLEDLSPAVHVKYDTEWKRRDVIGIHPQKQVPDHGGESCCLQGGIQYPIHSMKNKGFNLIKASWQHLNQFLLEPYEVSSSFQALLK